MLEATNLGDEVNASHGVRPTTPDSHTPNSTQSSPAKVTNNNGKRRMDSRSADVSSGDGPSIRRGEHLKRVRSALKAWWFKVKAQQYTLSPFTAVAILPDMVLTSLASNARIQTLEDLIKNLNPPWMMARRHGQEVLDLLKMLDDNERTERQRDKQRRKDMRRRETEERQAQRARQKAIERADAHTQKLQTQALQNSATFNIDSPIHYQVHDSFYCPYFLLICFCH